MEGATRIKIFKYMLCILLGLCIGLIYNQNGVSKFIMRSPKSYVRIVSNLDGSISRKLNSTDVMDKAITLINKHLAEATVNPIPQIPEYGLMNKSLCKDPRTRYILYAYSAPGHFEGRSAVRKTYGNKDLYKDGRLERVFFLGETKNKLIQEKIEKEALEFGDIVQMKYLDSYDNLVYKSIFTFKFFHDNCRKNVIAVKTDDDIFYDIFIIMDLFKAPKNKEKYIACPVWQDGTMPILRDPKSCAKWCVKENEFKGRTGYPKYCSGWGWIFSLNFVDDMMAAIARTHFFKVEDAFTTGVLMGQVKDLKYIDILGNTPIYATPKMHGTWHLKRQYTNMTVPRKLVLTDVANSNVLFEMWNYSVKSLHLKSKETLKELNLDALSNSLQNFTATL